ncbi:MAG: khg/kdpg aldolase family protein [Polyangiaceae bacterium]|jgi:2-dehydro-3-deoxyphosphogluconate aldolase/(4S)-4-hydroxy-2-oxoglutarate aldolase|nr:khg/kdpg aldolase family protein [Polyangiaceae bacterium]
MAPSSAHPVEACRQHRLVPVIAIKEADAAADLAAALAGGGLPIVEITMRTEAAAAAMRKIASGGAKVTLMAGTVTTPEQAQIAVDCGAELVISPGLNTRVVEWCLKQDVPVVPGVCTPTEIEAARNYGLKYLKFFPAEAYGGVKTLKALSDVYSAFSFMPTGGINPQNLAEYLKLPVVLACGGSWMAPGDLIHQRKFEAIQTLVKEAVATVASLSR